MRRSQALLILPAALAVAAGSCTAPTGPTFPPGASAVPASFSTVAVPSLPRACSSPTYFVASTSLCTSGLTSFLCDGSSYTEYDCEAPGAGWTEQTLTEDRVATGPSGCAAGGMPGSYGTAYVEGNEVSPGENTIYVFRYCNDSLPSFPVARYGTGGSGAADLNDTGVLDADQQVVVNEAGTLLFAVNQGSDTVAAFHIAADGLLTPVVGSPFPSGGSAPASVGISKNILVVSNKASDGVRSLGAAAPSYVTFTIGQDGSLTPTGSSYTLRAGASPTQSLVLPGGSLVFTTEESGVMRGFELSSTGRLTLAPGSPVSLPDSLFKYGRPSPVWPAGLSASLVANVLYTGIPNNNSIAAFDFTATGALTLIGGASDANARLPCWSVTSADGHRLYFANAGSDNISVWDIETDPRHPRLLQTFQMAGGGNPWGLHLDPQDKLLFVITPRQVRQVPEAGGQLLHGLRLAVDGTIGDELSGSPVPVPVATDTNELGVAVVGGRGG